MLEAQLPQFLEEVARLLRSGPPPASGGPMFRPRSSTNSAKHRPIALPGKIPIPQPAPNPSDGMRVSLTPSSEEPPELPFSDSPIRSENTEGSGFSARRHSRNVVLQILNGELPPPLTRQALESFTKQEFCYELIQYHDAYVAYCALASKIYTGSFSSLSDTDSNESLNKQTSDEHKGGSGLDPHASDEDIERVALEAERMASMFFGDDAPCELNITDSSRKGTLANLAAHNYHPFVFRTAHEQVIHSLQTSVLPRFVSEAQRTPTNVTSQDPSGLSVRRSTGEADVPGASPNVARMSRGKEALLGAFKDFKDTIKGSPSRKPSRGKVARDKSGDSGETNNNSSSGPEVRGSSGNEVRLE
ncbi:hypothetical protein M427DRAFT_312662 [Gonapodya prolifera JEL478]|uniref:RGS domain-containing protein n=1 Tax=Gonapodya prolifera (strain JEL478) TaxID=1344416 RepID=A0A139AWQ7_GONPJ|nr:hypothetical protein M427DRAFT_312662 [Gonapodya prolifera JEL478]|eukprot:KXS21158.1 hypothetical protein M427DRAFT_312662 [Gonapodya prolifera JEL478]